MGKGTTGSNGLRCERHRAPQLPVGRGSPAKAAGRAVRGALPAAGEPSRSPERGLEPPPAGARRAPWLRGGNGAGAPRSPSGIPGMRSSLGAAPQRRAGSARPSLSAPRSRLPTGTRPRRLLRAPAAGLSQARHSAPRLPCSALPCSARPCPPRRPLPSALPRSRPAGGRAARTRVPAPSRTHPPPCTCCPRHRGWGGPGRAEPHVGLTSALMQPRRRGGAEEMASAGPPSASGRGRRRSRARAAVPGGRGAQRARR